MKRLLLTLLAALAVSCTPLRSKIDASIVRITYEQNNGGCTGFMVKDGVVLTAAHCIDEGMLFDGKLGTSLGFDAYYDLAAYKTPLKKPILTLSDTRVKIDEPVKATGYALGWERPITTDCKVLLPLQKGPKSQSSGIMYQGLFVPGMSGGPIVDLSGKVVGIVQSDAYGVYYSVPAAFIHTFLEDIGVE